MAIMSCAELSTTSKLHCKLYVCYFDFNVSNGTIILPPQNITNNSLIPIRGNLCRLYHHMYIHVLLQDFACLGPGEALHQTAP